jgi:hypothetical protein
MSSTKSGCIVNGSKDLIEVLENLVSITCIVMSNGLVKGMEDNVIFEKEENEILFDELIQLYSSNPLIRRDFAEYINETVLFPPSTQTNNLIPISSRRSKTPKLSQRSN